MRKEQPLQILAGGQNFYNAPHNQSRSKGDRPFLLIRWVKGFDIWGVYGKTAVESSKGTRHTSRSVSVSCAKNRQETWKPHNDSRRITERFWLVGGEVPPSGCI
jgi:hypothetical protein